MPPNQPSANYHGSPGCSCWGSHRATKQAWCCCLLQGAQLEELLSPSPKEVGKGIPESTWGKRAPDQHQWPLSPVSGAMWKQREQQLPIFSKKTVKSSGTWSVHHPLGLQWTGLYLCFPRASELSPFRPLCNKQISKLACGRKVILYQLNSYDSLSFFYINPFSNLPWNQIPHGFHTEKSQISADCLESEPQTCSRWFPLSPTPQSTSQPCQCAPFRKTQGESKC